MIVTQRHKAVSDHSAGQGERPARSLHRGTSRGRYIFLDACSTPHAWLKASSPALLAVRPHSTVQGRSGLALAAPQAGKPVGTAKLHSGRAPAELDVRCCLETVNGHDELLRLRGSPPARRKAASSGHARAPLAMILRHRSLWVRLVHRQLSRRPVVPCMLPITWLECVRRVACAGQAVICVFGFLSGYAFFLQSRLPGEVLPGLLCACIACFVPGTASAASELSTKSPPCRSALPHLPAALWQLLPTCCCCPLSCLSIAQPRARPQGRPPCWQQRLPNPNPNP